MGYGKPMNINALYAGKDSSCSDLNTIISNNINNIHVIYIDFSLFLNELTELGVIDLNAGSVKDGLLNIIRDEFYIQYVSMFENMSSAELVNKIVENHILGKHRDSFLYKAYYYSIPIFISGIEIVNKVMPDTYGICIDGTIDLAMYKDINKKYDVVKYFMRDKSERPTIWKSILSFDMFKTRQYRVIDVDYIMEEAEGVKYLYDELMD